MKKISAIIAGIILVCGCKTQNAETEFAAIPAETNPNYVDVLYFVSTEVLASTDSTTGEQSFRAVLAQNEREAMKHEAEYIKAQIFPDSLNFFAPYYHQITMEGIALPEEELKPILKATEEECLEAFDYYYTNLNGGRPFILAGFSQGAQMVKAVLKSLNDSQFEKLRAAYVIGYELTEEDLSNPRIIPATGKTDRGVTISFNSVNDPANAWDYVSSNPAACINPVNWTTDATPAPLHDGDITLSASVDPKTNLLIVSGYGDALPKASFDAPWPEGCLHGQEIRIYNASLARNALDRAYLPNRE